MFINKKLAFQITKLIHFKLAHFFELRISIRGEAERIEAKIVYFNTPLTPLKRGT